MFVGVDVGTGSARAGVFTADGELLARASHPIEMRHPKPRFAEHRSENIWSSVCAAVRAACADAKLSGDPIRGIGFDAACSLVVRDTDGRPLSISPDGEPGWDTIVWMDHRAREEAEEATQTGAEPLNCIGGRMSPEMQTPKLAWIKRHLPGQWLRMGRAFDLADFLTWMATGSSARSACTLTCKWTYLAEREPHWDADYLAAMGLDDMVRRAGLPQRATPVGEAVGRLTETAADELGLTTECVVAAGLIDAHAGALGTLAPFLGDDIDRHVALIGGTSNCHMALARRPIPISGVWGPYADAVVPGYYLAEGGQSAAGALLDHIIARSTASEALGDKPHDALADIILARIGDTPDLAPDLHVLPDFHGNRSPLNDPQALGAITGLTIGDPLDELVTTYWSALASIAYETREIVEAMNAEGYRIETAHLSGGAANNPLFVKIYAEATNLKLTVPECPDPVLLGAAITAATAASADRDLAATAREMVKAPKPVQADARSIAVHGARYRRYTEFVGFQRAFHQRIRSG